MNSEELEISLRTEFESYLKDVLAEMRQEADEFQSKIEAEFEKHKSQFDEAFQSFAERFDSKREFDEAFTSSVAEHLRLARDEGARITATAMAEAEKLDEHERETTAAAAAPRYDGIRDAVNDISSKDSQSAILKALVQNAGEFAPRGAFFIIKNDHFVGWKVFGDRVETAEGAIKEIHFPTASDSIVGAAVSSLNTVQSSSGSHTADGSILAPLGFGEPAEMYAIPLMARGRGVAVLYADHGEGGGAVNREALETLVRVAGLTVELLAASQTASADARAAVNADFEEVRAEADTPAEVIAEPEYEYSDSYRQAAVQDELVYEDEVVEATVAETEPNDFAFSGNTSVNESFLQETPDEEFTDASAVSPFDTPETVDEVTPEGSAFGDYATQPFESEAVETASVEESSGAAFPYDTNGSAAVEASSPFDEAVESYEPAAAVTSVGFAPVAEQVAEAPAAAVPSAPYARLRDRPVDLPIEVPEDERRIHNDARRFARLLVSEIKLYNEKKVEEGRESQDLYERLREAIDRSREMYDKRVQPPVAEKFDYFHYEIVNSLADGEAQRLGSGYPGSTV